MDNLLNAHKNIEIISSKSREGLRAKLRAIIVPFGLVSLYFDGKEHVAWINPDRKLSPGFLEALNKIDSK